MFRLQRAGFSLVPLGGGDHGKAPLRKFKDTAALPLKQVLATMHRAGSACYGVRLNGLAVVDIDTSDPDLASAIEARFGVSSVHVRTPRGIHLYYRSHTQNLPDLRAEGLPIDIKRGGSAYVIGPRSVRPDGGLYVPLKGELASTTLTALDTSAPQQPKATASLTMPADPAGLIAEGSRHETLIKVAIENVGSVDNFTELRDILIRVRDERFQNAATMKDSEVLKIAEWAWKCRLENRIYRGRDSAFKVDRAVIDRLRCEENSSDAIALYVTLVDLHGHAPGKTFALDGDAMRLADLTDLSRRRFLAARRTLESIGALQTAGRYCPGKKSQRYSLARVHAMRVNTTSLEHSPEKEKKRG
ncbi:hypothetical protein HKCCSP123_16345 [Rhodobacterales bacterium HKCCSP123]|nr:hypothetical protein [Rhodobacterales bacterium HKCCSP123]